VGFEVVAVDLRTGNDTPSGTNRTVWASASDVYTFDDGIPDAEGALAWAQETLPDDPILLWGSGMSADFVIVMAANDPEGIAGVLAFSPPSTLTDTDEAEAASRLTVPLFVSYGTTPTDELATVSKITDAAPPELLTLHTPEVGAHGVVTLTESGNPDGWKANWAAMEEFLNRVAP
jgi:pimeloyl-ACP methyl ester carboxylesterase